MERNSNDDWSIVVNRSRFRESATLTQLFRQRNFHIFIIIVILLLKSKWICKLRWYLGLRIEQRETERERERKVNQYKKEEDKKKKTKNKTKSNENIELKLDYFERIRKWIQRIKLKVEFWKVERNVTERTVKLSNCDSSLK